MFDLSLGQVYADLMVRGDLTVVPEDEDCHSLVERISVPGRINEITEDTYWYFLCVLPPRLFNGNQYCFAEGDEPLRLFWSRNGHYFCRQLTREETNYVCDASGLPRDYGFY